MNIVSNKGPVKGEFDMREYKKEVEKKLNKKIKKEFISIPRHWTTYPVLFCADPFASTYELKKVPLV